jgi:hypothetical protein
VLSKPNKFNQSTSLLQTQEEQSQMNGTQEFGLLEDVWSTTIPTKHSKVITDSSAMNTPLEQLIQNTDKEPSINPQKEVESSIFTTQVSTGIETLNKQEHALSLKTKLKKPTSINSNKSHPSKPVVTKNTNQTTSIGTTNRSVLLNTNIVKPITRMKLKACQIYLRVLTNVKNKNIYNITIAHIFLKAVS